MSEVSWMLKRLKCRGWYTSDTSDTWVFEVSEVSEVCLTEPFRAIQSPPEPSRASFLEQDTSDTSDTWVFEVSEVSEVSEVCPTEPSKAILSCPDPPPQSHRERLFQSMAHFRHFKHLGV